MNIPPSFYFGDNPIHNKIFSFKEAQEELNIYWSLNNNDLFTIIFWDEDVPRKSPYIHYLEVNILGNKIGDILADYILPFPPSGLHRYHINFFRQNRRIKYNKIEVREKFNINEFTLGFELIDGVSFLVKSKNESIYHNKNEYFIPNTTLPDNKRRYCRCLIHVGEKGTAYNPYAVCAKSVKTTSKECSKNYNFQNFTISELKGYLRTHKLSFNPNSNKEELLNLISEWKSEKY